MDTELLVVFGTFVVSAWLLRPVAQAFAERLRGRRHTDPDAAVAAARDATLTELEAMRQRLLELEERVDFTERLMAQHRGGERLPPARG